MKYIAQLSSRRGRDPQANNSVTVIPEARHRPRHFRCWAGQRYSPLAPSTMDGVGVGTGVSLFLSSAFAFSHPSRGPHSLHIHHHNQHRRDLAHARSSGSNATSTLRLLGALAASRSAPDPQAATGLVRPHPNSPAPSLSNATATAAYWLPAHVTYALHDSVLVGDAGGQEWEEEGPGGLGSWLEEDCQSNSSGAWKLTSPVCSTKFASFPLFVAVSLVLAVITLWTILGNVLVLWALYRYRSLRTMSNCLIGNLAVSDLLLAVTVLPISAGNDLLGYWVFGRTMCTVWLCVDVLYCTASIWGLCTIALDRYTATVYPMWYHDQRSTRKALAYMLFVWLFSVVISLAPFIGWRDMVSNFYKYDPRVNRHMCVLFSTQSYVVYSALGSFVLPSCLMTFIYVKIFAVLHGQADTLKARAGGDSPRRPLANGGGCPTISISGTQDPVSFAVTRDVTASTFVTEETNTERVRQGNGGDTDRRGVVSDDEEEDEEEEEDDGSSDRGGYSPTRTEFDLEDVYASDRGDADRRHIPPFNANPTGSGCRATRDPYALRDQRSNSLHVEMETSFLRASHSSGCCGHPAADNNNGPLLPDPPPPKRDFLTVSTCDIPLQFCLKKSRSAAFNLQDAGANRRTSLQTLSVPRSKSASTLFVSARERCRRDLPNGGGGVAGNGGGGSGASSLSLHRLSLPWHGRRSQQMTTSMRRRFQLREQRATKRMLLIMACFFVCWMPFTLMYMLRGLCRHCPVLSDHLSACIIWLGYVNSSLNPLLYTLFNDDFRKAFKKLLHVSRVRRPS